MPLKVEPKDAADLYHTARVQMKGVSHEHQDYLFDGQAIDRVPSRAPYRIALGRDDRSFTVFGNSHTGTVLYELTGRGCSGLYEWERAQVFISPLVDRLTRIDLAVDMENSTRPSVFSNERGPNGFRSLSYITSDTGETVYIGSPKSDRFARVYRYNEPHPRSHLLRVEFVFRRNLARSAAAELLDTKTKSELMAKLGNTWGLQHREWRPEYHSDETIRTPSLTRNDEDTLMWLYKQVAPAIRRMLKTGALDMTDFLEKVYHQ